MTEQKYMKNFVRTYGKSWLIAGVIGVVGGMVIASQLSATYVGNVSIQLTRRPDVAQKEAAFYVYDGFYNEQSAVAARDNFAAWLTSPRTVYDIHKSVQLEGLVGAGSDMTSIFKTNDLTKPSTNVTLTYKADTEAKAQSLGNAIKSYTKDNYRVENIIASVADPLVLKSEAPKTLIIAAVALAVTFGTFFITLLMHYFRSDES